MFKAYKSYYDYQPLIISKISHLFPNMLKLFNLNLRVIKQLKYKAFSYVNQILFIISLKGNEVNSDITTPTFCQNGLIF